MFGIETCDESSPDPLVARTGLCTGSRQSEDGVRDARRVRVGKCRQEDGEKGRIGWREEQEHENEKKGRSSSWKAHAIVSCVCVGSAGEGSLCVPCVCGDHLVLRRITWCYFLLFRIFSSPRMACVSILRSGARVFSLPSFHSLCLLFACSFSSQVADRHFPLFSEAAFLSSSLFFLCSSF